jgi:hypothetical protein
LRRDVFIRKSIQHSEKDLPLPLALPLNLLKVQRIDKAKTDHQLAISNGSTDPTFSVDAGANPPLDPYVGVGVSTVCGRCKTVRV